MSFGPSIAKRKALKRIRIYLHLKGHPKEKAPIIRLGHIGRWKSLSPMGLQVYLPNSTKTLFNWGKKNNEVFLIVAWVRGMTGAGS